MIELAGGELDGREIEVDESIIRQRYIVLPKSPVLEFLPGQLSLADEVVTFTREIWEWDGTFTRAGAFRFRVGAIA